MAPTLERVVIINDSTHARGGATKLAIQLACALRQRDIPVTFFAGDHGDNDELREHGADIVALGGERLLLSPKGYLHGIYNSEAKRRLDALIADVDGPGVAYHVHSWAQIFSPSIFDALAPVVRRTAVTAHDFFLACPNGNFSIYPKSRQCDLKPLSPRCLVTDCDKRAYLHKIWRVARQTSLNSRLKFSARQFQVLAIQAGMTPFLTKGGVPEELIRVVNNPAAQLADERVRAEDNSEIIYVGRFEHEKGVDLLAGAAREAGARLRVIGEGEGEAAIRRAYPDAAFQGWSSPSEIAAAFRRARFFVMPSRCTEPFGLSGAEALRAGLPVLASQSCLIGADVAAKGMGAVCDIFDSDAFREQIKAWMADDSAIAAMSRAAYDRAGEIAQSDDDWADMHVEIYRKMAAAQQ